MALRKAAFIRNGAGWHNVHTIVAGAGVDLSGWYLNSAVGISVDGTRIWGRGNHNGNPEGWIAEFPVGYLAAYGASLPAQSIVGAWSGSDNTTEGASVVTFLDNGTYFHVEDARVADGPTGFDGYERGTYSWDPVTKAITLTTLVDYNGDIGLYGAGWGARRVDRDAPERCRYITCSRCRRRIIQRAARSRKQPDRGRVGAG